MPRPKRGEIFRVKMYGRQGTELYGKGPEKERPCLVVSSDLFSIDSNGSAVSSRLTVVPLTSYAGGRDDARPLWGIPIQLADGKNTQSDVDIDPANFSYPAEEDFQIWLTDQRRGGRKNSWIYYPNSTQKMPYKSIIDCGQLSTVNSFDPDEWPDLVEDYEVDVLWERRYGALREKAMLCVSAALQVVLDGGVRYAGKLHFRAGDVIIAHLTGPDRLTSQQYCLVVSSPGIDAIRERMPAFGKILEQCTVVPLNPIMKDDSETDPGIAFVTVHTVGRREAPQQFLANCQEIQTIDWGSRKATYPPRGYIDESDMAKVRKALRDYLALPQ